MHGKIFFTASNPRQKFKISNIPKSLTMENKKPSKVLDLSDPSTTGTIDPKTSMFTDDGTSDRSEKKRSSQKQGEWLDGGDKKDENESFDSTYDGDDSGGYCDDDDDDIIEYSEEENSDKDEQEKIKDDDWRTNGIVQVLVLAALDPSQDKPLNTFASREDVIAFLQEKFPQKSKRTISKGVDSTLSGQEFDFCQHRFLYIEDYDNINNVELPPPRVIAATTETNTDDKRPRRKNTLIGKVVKISTSGEILKEFPSMLHCINYMIDESGQENNKRNRTQVYNDIYKCVRGIRKNIRVVIFGLLMI